jgi:cytochrome P450
MFRVVTKDAEIAGCPMHAGDRMVLVYSAANRDPSVWGDDPDRFDPDRPNLNQHLAFGKGIHFCIGAPLSRLEMQVAFETLARRFKSIRLTDGNTFEYHPSFILRGLKRLNVELERAD